MRTNRRIVVAGKGSVSIRRNTAWGEYVVATRSSIDGVSGTYHTDDKADARATAANVVRMLRRLSGIGPIEGKV